MSASIIQFPTPNRCDERLYAAGTIYGRSTDTFGEGPDCYRLAVADARRFPALSPGQSVEALHLAVATLNRIAFLIRFGGLVAGGCYVSDEGRFDQEAFRNFEDDSISDLARAMVKLRNFGARA